MTSYPLEKYSTPVFKKDVPDDSFKFQELPAPSGDYPFHLDAAAVGLDINADKMVFHMVGDTGSVGSLDFQRIVVGEMAKQYQSEAINDKPKFLYHLGDVVYKFGEAANYFEQFFSPYRSYPGPIFAIAGNHDSDINPDSEVSYNSLDGFTAVFCDSDPRVVAFSGDTYKKSMTQPNIYWTLNTPLAIIIGLHSNVPKFGVITAEQRAWFAEELKMANLQRPGKAVIVCIHHAPYSADINHGSSRPMIEFFEDVFAETGIRPDIVFSGHVHNYQRFSKTYDDGLVVPFIVAGAGGYDELHAVAEVSDSNFTADSPLLKNVRLEKYCDNKHGFLKVTIEKDSKGLLLSGEYFSIPHKNLSSPESTLTDSFSIQIA